MIDIQKLYDESQTYFQNADLKVADLRCTILKNVDSYRAYEISTKSKFNGAKVLDADLRTAKLNKEPIKDYRLRDVLMNLLCAKLMKVDECKIDWCDYGII